MKLLIIGNQGATNVGWSFYKAAPNLGLEVQFLDARQAFGGSKWIRRWNWWLRGHRPDRLDEFSRRAVEQCQESSPHLLLTTGLAPVNRLALKVIRQLGAQCFNYLTDDPWNPTCRSQWFLETLPLYDKIFSVRKSNFDDLEKAGCRQISYLPFGFDPGLCYPETLREEEQHRLAADIVFVGGADRDRLTYLSALIQAGFKVSIYGAYWEWFRETRAAAHGRGDPALVRRATCAAKIALCLVRHSNRDGHVMRSLEIPAIGACMLAEDTPEHREIFGEDGECVRYFRTPAEAVEKTRDLLGEEAERKRLRAAAHQRIVSGKHTYRDRLQTMLELSRRS